MHDLEALAAARIERSHVVAVFARERCDFLAAVGALAAGENDFVRTGDVHDVAGGKFAARAGDADGEQAAALLAQDRHGGAVVPATGSPGSRTR